MNNKNENYLALLLQTKGNEAAKNLMSSLAQCDVLNMCYAYKHRVKSEQDLTSKVALKALEKQYELSDVTDVVGLRFVTLFRNELPDVLELLISIIQHQKQLTPNPFVKDSFVEVIFYTANAHDDLEPKIQDTLEKYNVKIEKNKNDNLNTVTSKQGYSSLHIVSRLNNKVDELSKDKADYYVPIEIQIRTVFEDAWGEIDHKYGYVLREGKKQDVTIFNPEHVMSHLKILKKFSDACAEYADAIYSEATIDFSKEVDSGLIISVSADDDVLLRFEKVGVSEEDISAFKLARLHRMQAKEIVGDLSGSVKKYLDSARDSYKLTENIDESLLTPENIGKYLFFYYSKMNEAICLLSTNIGEHIKAAFYIYSNLISIYPHFPLLRMRLAQAYGKMGVIDESLMHFTKAEHLIKDFEIEGCKFDDSLPKTDYDHIKKYLPKLFGFQLWHKQHYMAVENEGDRIEKITLLKKAYDVTKEALGVLEDDQKCSIHNNLLYYALELVELDSVGDNGLIEKIEEHFKFFEACVDIETSTNIGYLDTLSKTYEYMENSKLSEQVCDRIITLALGGSENDTYDRSEILEIAQEAFELKQKHISQSD